MPRQTATGTTRRPKRRTPDSSLPNPNTKPMHSGMSTTKMGPLDRAVASATPPAAAAAHTQLGGGGRRSNRRSAAAQQVAPAISRPLGLMTEKLQTLIGVVATIAPTSDSGPASRSQSSRTASPNRIRHINPMPARPNRYARIRLRSPASRITAPGKTYRYGGFTASYDRKRCSPDANETLVTQFAGSLVSALRKR